MKGYLIKITYLDGPHTGKSYLLMKGGYVTDAQCCGYWSDVAYKTLGIAKGVCKRLYNNNELNKRIERRDDEFRTKHGYKPKDFYLYPSQSYEPYEVEIIG